MAVATEGPRFPDYRTDACETCGRSEHDPFGFGEAGWGGVASFLRRVAKECIETRDPALVNAGAKLISEAVRADRLARDFRLDRQKKAELEQMLEMYRAAKGLRMQSRRIGGRGIQ